MASLFQPIDIYCERLHAGLLAEPLNAVTNLVFLLGAYVIWRQLRRAGIAAKELTFLTAMLAIIGIGSGLFHTFANRLTMLLDVGPILLFLLSFIWIFIRHIGGCSWGKTGLFMLLFVALVGAVSQLPHDYQLYGTVFYFPAWLYLVGMAIFLQRRGTRTREFWLAVGALTFSMAMRALDMPLCPVWPMGTHFLWHMGNGIVLYAVLKGLAGLYINRTPALTGRT